VAYATLAWSAPVDGVARLTLRRPDQLNALTWEMVEELHDVLGEAARDRALRAIVLTGEGRGFCSGIDLSLALEATDGDPVSVFAQQERIAALTLILRELPQPVIAAVNGPATGGGLALALACDIRLCVPTARFGVAFVRIGASGCDIGLSHLLPRIVGLGLASELMLTGRLVDADEAARIGLVNRVVAADDLLDAAQRLARDIASNSPFGVSMTKRVLHRNVDAPSLAEAIDLENRTQVLATRTDDMKEAIAAFRSKRAPQFSGS
jgi:enoyl-CoA hydratase